MMEAGMGGFESDDGYVAMEAFSRRKQYIYAMGSNGTLLLIRAFFIAYKQSVQPLFNFVSGTLP